jgi:high mobility group protein B3
MSRANNSMWKSLTNNLTTVLNQSLEEDQVKTVITNWETKKREISRLLDKTPKKKADPNAPKKPKTSYILFSIESRPKIKAQFPDLSTTDILKKLGEAWNKISDKEKKHYEELAAQDKERFESEIKSYVPSADSVEESGRKKQKGDGPKRPLTGYMYFCHEERNKVKEENPQMSGKEITKELANRWKNLTDAQKAPYYEKQKDDKVRYETEKKACGIETKSKGKKSTNSGTNASTNSGTNASTVESKSTSKKTESKSSTKTETKKAEVKSVPKKTENKTNKKVETKTNSKKVETKVSSKTATKTVKKTPGFEYFLNEQSEEVVSENPNFTQKKVLEVVSDRWNSLSQAERQAYENEADVGSEVELDDE